MYVKSVRLFTYITVLFIYFYQLIPTVTINEQQLERWFMETENEDDDGPIESDKVKA